MSTPETFGRFTIERELGRGAMGVVYLARDPVVDRPVAVKAIQVHSGLSEEHVEELRQRFMNEARSAANLSHPNIVEVHEAGFEDDAIFIAMEFVEGESLEDILGSERRLTYEEVADLLLELAAALDHAHGAGIVHRDIKPGNVLVDRHGTPRVADFGVARQAASTLTATGTVIGTPAYMSPEQITGHTVTGASDQFSLAALVYEMLTGGKPFDGEDATTVLYRIVHEEPRSLLELRDSLPRAVDAAVRRGLAKNPAERYESCRELARAVQAALRAVPLDEPAAVTAGVPAMSAGSGGHADDTPFDLSATTEELGERSTPPWLLPATVAGGALLILTIGALWLMPDESEAPALPMAPGATGIEVGLEPETFSIQSEPPGARLTLDGRVLEGNTPLSVALDPEVRHTLLLEIPGYESISWAFTPEELPDAQRDSGRLFFPFREETDEADVADDAEGAVAVAPREEADALEPYDPVEIRGREMEPPEVVERVEPQMPEWAIEEGLQPYVVLRTVVDKRGRVREASPYRPVHPDLERLAVQAVLQWRLEPATRSGEPVDAFHSLTVRFRQDDGDGRP